MIASVVHGELCLLVKSVLPPEGDRHFNTMEFRVVSTQRKGKNLHVGGFVFRLHQSINYFLLIGGDNLFYLFIFVNILLLI